MSASRRAIPNFVDPICIPNILQSSKLFVLNDIYADSDTIIGAITIDDD